MKRKIFSLIICMLLVFTGVVFSACKKDNGYNLNNLQTDFEKVAKDYDNINYTSNGKFEFDYSKYSYENENYFISQIDNGNSPYSVIRDLNTMFDNSMTFSYSYISKLKNNMNADKTLKNKLKTNLDNLHKEMGDVSRNIQVLALGMEFNLTIDETVLDEICMNKLENLILAYNDMLQASFDFNMSVSKIYFNYCLTSSKDDYSKQSLDSFNVNAAIANLSARSKYQMCNLTQSYFELNLKGKNVPKQLVSDPLHFTGLGETYSTYIANVNAINVDNLTIDTSTIDKQSFYDLSVELFNYQSILDNDFDMYNKASSSINYIDMEDTINLDNFELTCMDIIENRSSLVQKYNNTLSDAIDILK